METITMTKQAWKMLDGARAGEKESREVLRALYISAAREVVSTNGRMLVKLKAGEVHLPDNTPAGAYEIVAEGKPDKAGFVMLSVRALDVQYPDIEKVIPAAGKVEDQTEILVPDNAKKYALEMSSAVIQLYRHTESAFNFEYLTVLGHYSGSWTVDKTEKDKVARFTAPGAVAIVLPFKIN